VSTPKARKPKPPMDGLTAIAFAREAFEQLHPVVPAWFWRYAAPGGVTLEEGGEHYVVGYVWMPRASRSGAERFFEARVNAWNARTTVTLDTPIDKYAEDELLPYDDPDRDRRVICD
jgi:hypothetical protein